jgi:endogenous inhibitor of DNA gyrase (YacG/DUF329 family)
MYKCLYCGNNFTGRKRKYCCYECRRAADLQRLKNKTGGRVYLEKICPKCGKVFKTRSPLQRLCSKKCKRNTTVINCPICGKNFHPSNRHRQKYCSKKCSSINCSQVLCKYKNKDEKLAARRKSELERKKSDPSFALKVRMRILMYASLRRVKNCRSWQELAGYSIADLRHHIEKQFNGDMCWDRFLNGEIHIDHIIPVSAFNYTSPEHIDFKKCWSLKNLRPMWAKENLSKGAKINEPFQRSLLI